jgi:hypothetical protein
MEMADSTATTEDSQHPRVDGGSNIGKHYLFTEELTNLLDALQESLLPTSSNHQYQEVLKGNAEHVWETKLSQNIVQSVGNLPLSRLHLARKRVAGGGDVCDGGPNDRVAHED